MKPNHLLATLLSLSIFDMSAAPAQVQIIGPRELIALRASYDERLAEAVRYEKDQYVSKLRGLAKSLKDRGRSDAAATVERELKVATQITTMDGTRASKIIFPRLGFRNASVLEVVNFMIKKSLDLDPEHTGIPIILHPPPVDPDGQQRGPKINLDLGNISVVDAAKHLAIKANLVMTRDGEVIILKSK